MTAPAQPALDLPGGLAVVPKRPRKPSDYRDAPYPMGDRGATFLWVRGQRFGSVYAKAAMRVLVDHDHKATGGPVFPGRKTIAAESDMAERTVSKALRDLRAAGWITSAPRQGRSTRGTFDQFEHTIVPDRLAAVPY